MSPKRHRWSFDKSRHALRTLATAWGVQSLSNKDLLKARQLGWDVPTEQGLKGLYGSAARGKADAGLLLLPEGGRSRAVCRNGHPKGKGKCRPCDLARLRDRYRTDPEYRHRQQAAVNEWRRRNRERYRVYNRGVMRKFRQRQKLAILHRTARAA